MFWLREGFHFSLFLISIFFRASCFFSLFWYEGISSFNPKPLSLVSCLYSLFVSCLLNLISVAVQKTKRKDLEIATSGFSIQKAASYCNNGEDIVQIPELKVMKCIIRKG
eukprot:TRINITY_DN18694_c0_g1_i1.p1 TRINITY_DN18694_c0_g1~~TRINITY_DN18694_c0_g1_i1.p1  ORF type:complete len:110 (-),score=7.31 TRINITY_DN18694_c0_g1_i1:767-1096(-)